MLKFYINNHHLNPEYANCNKITVNEMINQLGYIDLGYDSQTTALMSATWKER